MRVVSRLLLVVAAMLPTVLITAAQTGPAQNYPTKPIRIIVGFTAGGGNDILARLVGQKLSESLRQPVIIENKPGAGAMIATEYVARAAPDGYTLLMGASGAMTINPAVYTPFSSPPNCSSSRPARRWNISPTRAATIRSWRSSPAKFC